MKKNKKPISIIMEDNVEAEQEPVDADTAVVIETISNYNDEQRQTE